MAQVILDDFRTCNDPDCINPDLLEKWLSTEILNQEEENRVLYFLDECKECKEYFLKLTREKEAQAE